MQITKTNQTIWDTLQPSLLAFARPYRRAFVLFVIFLVCSIIFFNGLSDEGLKNSSSAMFNMFFCFFPFFAIFSIGKEDIVGSFLASIPHSFFFFKKSQIDQNPVEPLMVLSHPQVVPLSPPRFHLA
jgi:uncharacterized membrane protein YjjP (DUF1212 family)